MTVPGTPLPGLPVGGITPPWKVVPAHVVIHTAIFIGTLLTLMVSHRHSGALRLIAGPPTGMNAYQWVTWLIVGLGGAPVMGVSYWLATRGGRSRYLSLWVHIIANFMAEATIIIYMYAASAVGGILPGWAFGWTLVVGVMVFLVWLLLNDSLRLRQLERLATKLQRTDKAVREAAAADSVADAADGQ